MKTRSEEEPSNRNRVKKNKFLVCFFPVDANGVTGKKKSVGKTSSDRYDSNSLLTYSYISVAQEKLFPVIISSKSEIEEGSGDDSLKRRRKIAPRLLARIENLTGKVRTVKVQQDPNQTKISSEKNEEQAISLPKTKRNREDSRKVEKINSSSRRHSDSVTSSSSLIGSKGSPPKSLTRGENSNSITPSLTECDCTRKELKLAGKFNPVTGLYLLAISLLIMLIWGKVCAIVCTLTWLYFVPRWETVNNTSESDEEAPKSEATRLTRNFQTSEYKKKVIMEGLLERNRRI